MPQYSPALPCAMPANQPASHERKHKMNSNAEKLLTLINEYITPLPALTLSQLFELIDAVTKLPTIYAATKLLCEFYATEQIWNMQRGDDFCRFVQQSDDTLMPNPRSKLGLKKAVEIIRFIENNLNFLK
jgi:hypothetical protein